MQMLCHYTSNETAKLILESNIIRFGKVSCSNDPIEIKHTSFSYSGEDEDTEEMINSELDDYLNNILTLICFAFGEYPINDEDYLSEHGGILHDLTSRPPFYLPRTWALYGRGHTGACLVFEKSLFLAQTSNQIKNGYHYLHKPIEYNDFLNNDVLYDMSKSHFFDEDEISKKKTHQIIQEYLEINAEYNYFQKDLDWRDENEYRFLAWNKNDNNDFGNLDISIKGSLRAIVVGLNNEDKEIIYSARRNGVKIYKLIFEDFIRIEEP
jgi:hypothetical protein